MALIYQLPLLSQASPGDQLAVYAPNTGDARRLPMSALLTFFQQQFASPTMATNLYTPGTGFNIAGRGIARAASMRAALDTALALG